MGTAFGFQLARAGHEVTLVARGERLARLRADGAIETVMGERATVSATEALDPCVPWDGVMVTVLAHQVGALLPALKASAARSIVFLFNTLAPLQTYRDAVGAERASFGFPVGTALLVDGQVKANFTGPGMATYLGDAAWVKTLREAKMRTVHMPDMESFLRAHAAFVIPLMASGWVAFERKSGITWSEARQYSRAMREGFDLVRSLGHAIVPGDVALLDKLPQPLVAAILWAMSRTQLQRDLGSMGPGEARELIDALTALAPGQGATLRAIRP
jgi:2-dehydropantoate 2-reductase